MKKKISKFAFLFCLPVVAFLTLAIFLVSGLASGYVSAENVQGAGMYIGKNATMEFSQGMTLSENKIQSSSGEGGGVYVAPNGTLSLVGGSIIKNSAYNGGGVYVASNGLLNQTSGSISENIGYNGGGVYIANDGTFNMNGGIVSGNTAISYGNDIYNAGTFTMTNGTIGTSGSSQSGFGIYNSSTMNLYGGTIYDSIYSSKSFNTKTGVNIVGAITLGNDATITVQDYSGTTPSYNILLSSSRPAGTILTLQGSSTAPDLTKLNITGYDTGAYTIKAVQGSSSTEWNVVLAENSVEFPTTWKTEVASTTYMSTTVTPTNLTSIKFESSVPSGYTQIGTLSTGLKVYQSSTTSTEIAFVNNGTICAPKDSSSLFCLLTSLKTLMLNNFNTSEVTDMSDMFSFCWDLEKLDLSNFETINVTDMSNMFNRCGAVLIGLSSFDTSNVTNMSSMFEERYVDLSLDLSNFNTSKVTDMSGMFEGCINLNNLDLSSFDTSNVTSMSGMFEGCYDLTSLNLSNFNTSKVTSMTNMFKNCKDLTSLNLNNFNTSKVTDMTRIFEGCSSLINLDLKSFDTSNVTYMDHMFLNCSGLTSLDVSGFNTSNVKNMGYMFHSCSSLTSLNVKNFDTSKVTDMQEMFDGCLSLKNLDLSSFDTSNVKYMTAMIGGYHGCPSLTSLDLSNFDTSNVESMWGMFYNCSSLETLDISSFDMTNVTSSDQMLDFGSSGKLKHLKTPYNNASALTITNGNTLYNVKTGVATSSVPANTTESLTLATKVSVTLDPYNGTLSSSATTSFTCYFGMKFTDTYSESVLPTPTRSGYTFQGWYSATSGGYSPSKYVFTTDTATFYAHWYDNSSPGGETGGNPGGETGGGTGGSSDEPIFDLNDASFLENYDKDQIASILGEEAIGSGRVNVFMNNENYNGMNEDNMINYDYDLSEEIMSLFGWSHSNTYSLDDIQSIAFVTPANSCSEYNDGTPTFEIQESLGSFYGFELYYVHWPEGDIRSEYEWNYVLYSDEEKSFNPFSDSFNSSFFMTFPNVEVIDLSGLGSQFGGCAFRIPKSVKAVIYPHEGFYNFNCFYHDPDDEDTQYDYAYDVYYGSGTVSSNGTGGYVNFPWSYDSYRITDLIYSDPINSQFDYIDSAFIFFNGLCPELYNDYIPLAGVQLSAGIYYTVFYCKNDRFGLIGSEYVCGIYGGACFDVQDFLSFCSSNLGAGTVIDMRGAVFNEIMVNDWYYVGDPDVNQCHPVTIIRSQWEPEECLDYYEMIGDITVYSYRGDQLVSTFASSNRLQNQDPTIDFEISENIQAVLDDEKRRYFISKEQDLDDVVDGEDNEIL